MTLAIGKSKAMDLVLTGRHMDALEAEKMGLVSRIFPANELVREALKVGDSIAQKSIHTVSMAKEAINNSFYEFSWEPKRLKGSRVGSKIAFTNFNQIIEEVNAGKDERYERYDLATYYKDFIQEVDSLACI